MAHIFFPQRSLLNPKFNGYKLKILDQDEAVKSFVLPSLGATQSTISSRGTAPLSFQEVQSRVKHNHLYPGLVDGEFSYVDGSHKLSLVRVDPVTSEALIETLIELPVPIQTSVNDSPNDYPVAIALDRSTWLVSDGRNTLHLVSGTDTAEACAITSSYHYVPESVSDSSPSLRVHSAFVRQAHQVLTIISHRVLIPSDNRERTEGARPSLKTVFDVVCISLTIPDQADTAIRPVDVIWKRRGNTVPLAVEYDPSRVAFLLIGGSPYANVGEPQDLDYIPAQDELAPVPRAGEQLDLEAAKSSSVIPQLPPYSWTQTSDSVTVAFPLPSSTPASSIRVTIAAKHLNLLVATESSIIPIPRYLNKHWWGDVDASSCFWTWDKEGDRQKSEENAGGPQTVGLLTLHLEKRDEGTRWSHVFQSVGTDSTHPQDVEVPETVDPSEMYRIRESLEKYTASLIEGVDTSGLGFGGASGMPSLGQGEYDEEVDANAGTPIVLTWVSATDQTTTWTGKPWPSEVTLLSRALPMTSGEQGLSSIVIKHDIDGLLFDPPAPPPPTDATQHPALQPWTHSSSFSALAFVLASKRDLRFVHHIGPQAVFAFEGGNRMGQGGENVYIYCAPQKSDAATADQAVLRIGGGDAGALLGVGGMIGANGKVHVVCLCEKRLVVLNDAV